MAEFAEIADSLKTGENEYIWPTTSGQWAGKNRILIIEGRPLLGEMMAYALQPAIRGTSVRLIRALSQAYPKGPHIAVYSFLHRRTEPPMFDMVIERLNNRLNGTPLIVITEGFDLDLARIVERHGVRGWVPASYGFDILIAAIRAALAGGAFMPDLSGAVPHDIEGTAPDGIFVSAALPEIDLTEREHDVLSLLRQGKSNKMISFELSISQSTTKVHISNIMRKLHVHNRTQVAILSKDGPSHASRSR